MINITKMIFVILSLVINSAYAFDMTFKYSNAQEYRDSINELRERLSNLPNAGNINIGHNVLPTLPPQPFEGDYAPYEFQPVFNSAIYYSRIILTSDSGRQVAIIINNTNLYIVGIYSNGVFSYVGNEYRDIQITGVDNARILRNMLAASGSYSDLQNIMGVADRFTQNITQQTMNGHIESLAQYPSQNVSRARAISGVLFFATAISEATRFSILEQSIIRFYDTIGYRLTSTRYNTLITNWRTLGNMVREHSDNPNYEVMPYPESQCATVLVLSLCLGIILGSERI